ncbi:hypothetical protein K490DRAFT_51451 [Saccharata proteae CBS 121410]|uniref:Peroxisome assembly protein 12 n=1 Tax=Saccharata proteae CBS 121410 TaxID=1314787 RepID=A0A9P4LRG3_9PEZI|nr:hypothetical protein K490DRAFT_51451 [Saccharata proteae CBS 121410]
MEFMANTQGGFDELKPSLFELLSETQLSSLLPPSLRYLLTLAVHRQPRYLLPVLNSFDEVYALVSLLLERHFLTSYGGSFTENFYGLKRERVLRTKGGEVPRATLAAPDQVRESLRLRERDVWTNLAVLVGVPWVRRKLDEGWEVHAAHTGSMVVGPGFRDRREEQQVAGLRARALRFWKWFLRRVYPGVNAAYYFALLAFNLAYLFDGSKFHSPLLWLVGTRIRRMNAADHRAIDLAANPPPPPASTPRGQPGSPGQANSGLLNPRTLGQALSNRALGSLRILLPTSIFLLKFLEWWHQSDFARQLSRQTHAELELPPPIVSGMPKKPSPGTKTAPSTTSPTTTTEKSSIAAKEIVPPHRKTNPPISATSLLPILTVDAPGSNADPAACPICLGPIQTPTASPSGFVYCYTCIHRWVDGAHERQEAFMEGRAGDGDGEDGGWAAEEGSRKGRWESGEGRDAVTGRRVLGGTGGLRRVVV